MKVVLSRKGFDSSFGGHPSIILPDNTYVSFPIPGDEDELCYSDVQTVGGRKMDEVLGHFIDKIFYYQWEKFGPDTHCHLDPDIDIHALPRMAGWRGCFGQADAAQTVLEKHGLAKDDLFLFFGWFKRCVQQGEQYLLEKGNGIQCVYGYLQIGDIIHTSQVDKLPPWLEYHSHALQRRMGRKSNCIYVARETLSWDSSKRGYGLLSFNDLTELTKSGYSRSRWKQIECLRGKSITYHSPASWKDGYFQSACRGQEFVIEEDSEVEKWAKQMIDRSGVANWF